MKNSKTTYRPEPGDVIEYGYLWADEADRGQVIGRKDRPCLVLAVTDDEILVIPITSQKPEIPCVELPERTQKRLRLKYRSWVVVSEYNAFLWRGPDVVPTPSGDESYGPVPARFFQMIKEAFLQLNAARRVDR